MMDIVVPNLAVTLEPGSQILCRFHWDCGRMGNLQGVFVTTRTKLASAIGLEIRFGEVLGKHSDIHGTLEEDEVEVLTDDPDFIAKCEKFGLVPIGHNPLSYLEWKGDKARTPE